MSEESIKDRVVNNLLLLYLIEQTNKKGKLEDPLKLQKLVFLSQKKTIAKKGKGFNYNFFRWQKGPYSADVSEDLKVLMANNYVSGKYEVELTDQGREVLSKCAELLTKNKRLLEPIDAVIEQYAQLDPEKIKNEVYKMQVIVPRTHQLARVEQLPPRQLILFRSSDESAKLLFDIDGEWLATLELIFDQEALDSLRRAQKDATEGRARGIDHL